MQTLHHRDGHHGWDARQPPVATIAPGDEVELSCQDASDGQLDPTSATDDVATLDLDRANPLTGPVFVDSAAPGDALVVDVLEVAGADWGWTAVIPGFGLLADDFPDAHLRISRVADGRVDVDGLAILDHLPFLGTVGVAPATDGPHSVIPPRRVGGNMDLRDVRPGARLVLPVEVAGGLLSVGDGHAVQADGEVCGTAVETPTTTRLRVTVERGAAPATPRLSAPAPPTHAPGRVVTTTGLGPDLHAGARDAVRSMVDVLGTHGVDPADAYLLCSLAGNLRVGEVVNVPNWLVACTFPLDVLS